MDDQVDDDLTYRSIEWTHGIIRDWLAVTETAQAMQENMPPLVQDHLAALPSGFSGLAGAVALTINPKSLVVAQAILSSSDVQFESLLATGSLSHPVGTLADKTDAEMGTVTVGGDEQLRERVRELEGQLRRVEHERDELRRAMRMVRAGLDEALVTSTPRCSSSSASASPGR